MAKEPKFKVGDAVFKVNHPSSKYTSNRRGKIVKYQPQYNRAKRLQPYYSVLFDGRGTPELIAQKSLRLIPRTPAETITTKS